ncbi:MAG: DUF4154 domain-containing protein [Methylococcaceae bacterium]|nr:DUF4154 domain-containing protein [Methylococcaceae bacterium]
MTKTLLPLILCALIFLSCTTPTRAQSLEKQTVLTMLTLNIARFTRWPEQVFINTESTLNLCVFGDNIIQQSFTTINNKTINNNTLHIVNISRLRNLKRCQILYLSDLERNRLTSLLEELKGQPILTIGENLAFIKAGGMIGLELIQGKFQLNINLPIVKEAKLVISSRLLKLAKIFDFSPPDTVIQE